MRRPLDAQPTQIGQTDVYRSVVLVKDRVQFNLQTDDSRLIDRARGARGKHRQARLGGCQLARQELAFSPAQLQREHEIGPMFPPVV